MGTTLGSFEHTGGLGEGAISKMVTEVVSAFWTLLQAHFHPQSPTSMVDTFVDLQKSLSAWLVAARINKSCAGKLAGVPGYWYFLKNQRGGWKSGIGDLPGRFHTFCGS
jgi:hypothetical protein